MWKREREEKKKKRTGDEEKKTEGKKAKKGPWEDCLEQRPFNCQTTNQVQLIQSG